MNEWCQSTKKMFSKYFSEYGKITYITVLIFVCTTSIYLIFLYAHNSKLKVSFLDVGQGDSILIQTPSGHSMLIDGGQTDNVLERIANQLSYFNNHIDVVISTHPDADHVTGLIPVLKKYKVDTIVISPAHGSTQISKSVTDQFLEEKAIIRTAHTKDIIDFHDGVMVHVLHPSINYKINKNDTNGSSVSVVIIYGDKSFLLTGDLPSTEESNIITSDLPEHITVYKSGHHGSRYSSGEQLLSYIKPEYSVISAGKNNKYGHPNIETIERLKKYSKQILSTLDNGDITFITDGRSTQIETFR